MPGEKSASGKDKKRELFFFQMFHAVITSIYILAAEVPPIEKHQLDLVAFVEGDEKDE